jgi:beta-galactosidase
MSHYTRRDLLKLGAAAPAAARELLKQGVGSSAADDSTADNPIHQAAAAQNPSVTGSPAAGREKLCLDFGWRFQLGNANDAEKDFHFGESSILAKSGRLFSVCRENFDDSSWREVDLPHDWAVELPFDNGDGHVPAVKDNLVDHGCKPLGRDFPSTSIGWYRRVFNVPAEDAPRRIWLIFDGVYRDATFALNGHYLGRNMSGYVPVRYDVSDWINFGAKNILVVRVDATENEGWFYEGAGIYRHVWLEKTHSVHVKAGSDFVACEVRPDRAIVRTSIILANDGEASQRDCSISFAIEDAAGNTKAGAMGTPVTIDAHSETEIKHELVVLNPALWSLEAPNMYRLVTVVASGGNEIERYVTPFGIRTIQFDPNRGFFLNGTRVAIQGTCNHQDHAGVGAALPDRLNHWRIERLKQMGCNAYRTSHNPPTPELLEACDRVGMLVMDETRMMDSSEEGLSQLERMVRRDRNHPSIILWSIGNEEPEQGTERGARIATTMKDLVRQLDPTRPVTEAMNGSWGKGLSAVVDVQGFNYKHQGSVDDFHSKFPAKPCVGTEEASTLGTRGIYANDPSLGYMSAYDVNHPEWGSNAEDWLTYFAQRAWLAGAFVWTGFDYRGEPTPYSWPCISSHFGIMDTCGFAKDNFYYYQAWWQASPVLHVFPHWNWAGKEGQPIKVWVHSNCDEVELFLNGTSLGRKQMPRLSHLEWDVPYAPGTLEARGFKGSLSIATSKIETTTAPAAIRLRPDRAAIQPDGRDLSVVSVAILDANGRVVPIANNEISFEISGPGKIIGVGNGNPTDHSADRPLPPYTSAKRSAFNGYAQAIVQSARGVIDADTIHANVLEGDITLTASAAGLSNAQATITAAKKT